ncbi:MAG: hypothetical protein U1F20_04650 [Lysobacterales bacterium]
MELAIVVLHAGERHQLYEIEEVPVFSVGMAVIHALALFQHTARIHRLRLTKASAYC